MPHNEVYLPLCLCIYFLQPQPYFLYNFFLRSFAAYSQDPANCIFNTTITETIQSVVVPPGVICFTCDFGRGVTNDSIFLINHQYVPSYDEVLVISDSRRVFPQKKYISSYCSICISFDGETTSADIRLDGRLSLCTESSVLNPLHPFFIDLLSPTYVCVLYLFLYSLYFCPYFSSIF